MIKIAICDDEPLLQEQLARELSAILVPLGQTFTADYFSNGLKLLASPLNYDLVFLDIRMPGPNGITLAQTLRSRKFQGALIFVTAFMEHMPDAFEVEATDYLVKPIQPKRLEGALQWLGKQNQQIFLFTCQKREIEILERRGIAFGKIMLSR